MSHKNVIILLFSSFIFISSQIQALTTPYNTTFNKENAVALEVTDVSIPHATNLPNGQTFLASNGVIYVVYFFDYFPRASLSVGQIILVARFSSQYEVDKQGLDLSDDVRQKWQDPAWHNTILNGLQRSTRDSGWIVFQPESEDSPIGLINAWNPKNPLF